MVTALILSGGVGSRLGGSVPKQYIEVNGKPVIIYCLETICASGRIDAFRIVADDGWQPQIRSWLASYNILEKFQGFSRPGETRQLSIYNGLSDLMETSDETDFVFVHDAARPLVSADLISSCLDAAAGHDGVLPVLPMKDTVYVSEDGQSVSSLIDRKTVFAGQAPEVFVLGKYFKANQTLVDNGVIQQINGASEPAIIAGMDIVMVPGDESNFKLTTMSDLNRFEQMMKG